ncbi:DNA-binding transcriptional LysR family regulator [Bradyrhizobium sp. F1.13.1]
MELHQLRCFVAAAEQLHFGRAAQHLQMLPSALGRQIKLLEQDLDTRLFARTTRAVSLTEDGAMLLRDARAILARVEAVESNLRNRSRAGAARKLRVGAIDSAAAGLLPALLRDFRAKHPDIAVQLLEDKTVRLLPKILTGALDLAFVRPPAQPDKRLEFRDLLQETQPSWHSRSATRWPNASRSRWLRLPRRRCWCLIAARGRTATTSP